MAKGRLGAEIDVATGRDVARCCLLNGLAVLREALGSLDHVRRAVKLVGFVSSAPGFYDQPAVVDGASHALAEIFGPAGQHGRSAVGVAALPRDVPVEIEFVVAVT
jgi:enamine deaminase RidA (YjgF/YER057c/UK114 family)